MSVLSRMHAEERGSSLVFVMVFVMTFAVVITALLGFTSTALNANKQTTDIARQIEAAEAGAEFGLQSIRAGAAAPFASPGPTTIPLPGSVNGESVAATITQRDATRLCIAGPGSAVLNTPTAYAAGLAAACTGTETTVPYGATWSVSPSASATITAAGVFTATTAGAYTITARLGNVRATKSVTVP